MHLYDLTRNKSFLRRGCAIILLASVLVSWMIRLVGNLPAHPEVPPVVLETDEMDVLHHKLERSTTPSPDDLAEWLRIATRIHHQQDTIPEIEVQTLPADDQSLPIPVITKLFQLPIQSILEKHTHDPEQKLLFSLYLQAIFHPEPILQQQGYEHLQKINEQSPTPRFAREFLGDVQSLHRQRREALQSYLIEASRPEAKSARQKALKLALYLEDDSALRQLVSLPHFMDQETDHLQLRQIAHALKDRLLLAKSHGRLIRENWSQTTPTMIALAAFLIWSIILFCSGNRQKRMLTLCALAVIFGVLSAWLARWGLDAYQYGSKSAHLEHPDFMRQLLYCILYVGVPEESAKLILLLPWIPWMLIKLRNSKSDSNDAELARTSALLGGFTGLGFALEENLQYFIDGSEAMALGRLLTANVIHLSLTGYVAWNLFYLIRSRFHLASQFLTAFALMVAAHGLYDFLLIDPLKWEMDFFAFAVLALVARQYFRTLTTLESNRRRFQISRTCIFVFGATFLTGLVMVLFTWRSLSTSFETIVPILQNGVALIPVALIYIHVFDEVR